MSDDQWRAPGREHSNGTPPAHDDASRAPSNPPPLAGSNGSTNPYAPPSSPYAAPPPSPYGPPPGAAAPGNPYAGPAAGGPPPGSPAGAFATSERHRDRVLGGTGYDSPAYRNDKVAVTSMVLGVVGVIIPGVCLFAVAFGHLALHRLRTSYEGGRGLAIAGLSLGYAMTAIWLGILLLTLTVRTVL